MMAPVQPTSIRPPRHLSIQLLPCMQAQACSVGRDILFPSTQPNIYPYCISQCSFWPLLPPGYLWMGLLSLSRVRGPHSSLSPEHLVRLASIISSASLLKEFIPHRQPGSSPLVTSLKAKLDPLNTSSEPGHPTLIFIHPIFHPSG